jgi:hypothetical protein
MEINMSDTSTVTRHLVPEDQRMAKDYCGSYWQIYTLGDGGFYMAPDGHSIYQVCCDD